MTDASTWPNTHDTTNETMFYCDSENNCNIEVMGRTSNVPNNTTLIISGWQVYKNGKFECPKNSIVSCYLYNGGNRHPRSVIGIGADKHIYLFSVEGRLTDFQGANLTELSKIMSTYSITSAINLDGGGSTTLVIDGERVNRLPEYQGDEQRVVPNHIGFKVE
jgi:exopolysaccharide biosynthesis protein